MFNNLQIFVALTSVLIGALLVRYFSNSILKTKASLGQSFLVSSLSILAAIVAMTGYSSWAGDSSFTLILPFIVQFIVGGIATKLCVWKRDEVSGDGFPESFLMAFVLVTGTVIGLLFTFLMLILVSPFARILNGKP